MHLQQPVGIKNFFRAAEREAGGIEPLQLTLNIFTRDLLIFMAF